MTYNLYSVTVPAMQRSMALGLYHSVWRQIQSFDFLLQYIITGNPLEPYSLLQTHQPKHPSTTRTGPTEEPFIRSQFDAGTLTENFRAPTTEHRILTLSTEKLCWDDLAIPEIRRSNLEEEVKLCLSAVLMQATTTLAWLWL
ncbi:hypothetical protein LENED_004097 [Lentinula edodes]|uniref:Uncharacterized protein n=1 Tax=Lentinula edodes TaxID=5353 RepID=A0A1Q3E5B8_LENED|nr:hypothetical protein LENED_004097 [Lentinula edodes]